MAPRANLLPARQATQPALPAGISSDWWSQAQANIQKEEYNITWQDAAVLPGVRGAYQAPNRAQGFRTYFTEEGIRVVPKSGDGPKWEWGLALMEQTAGARRQEAVGADQKPAIHVSDNRIEFDRGWITEWYVNSPEGLEQGFTIPNPLPETGSSKLEAGRQKESELRAASYELRLDLRLNGNLHPRFSEDGQAADFYAPSGNVGVLHYAKLIVKDATGRELPARFEGWAGGASSELRATVAAVCGSRWTIRGPPTRLPWTR